VNKNYKAFNFELANQNLEKTPRAECTTMTQTSSGINFFFFISKRNFINSAKCNQVHREYTRTAAKKKRKIIQENHYK
jgi:hypothetical protein